MISSIELYNYKSYHKESITPGIFASIIGDSEAGKSNLIRALKMVVLNEPFPEHHIRHGAKSAYVTVSFNDGRKITRKRDSKGQSLLLERPGSALLEYRGIKGHDEEVWAFTGFKPIALDKNVTDIVQIVDIDERDFMLSGISPESYMRRLMKLMAGVGIETAKINLESTARQIKSKIDVQESVVSQHEATLSKLDNPVWNKLRSKTNNLQAKQTQVDAITALLETGGKIMQALNQGKKLADVQKKVKDIAIHLDLISRFAKEYNTLTNGLTTGRQIAENITKLEDYIEAKNWQISGAEQYIKNLEAATKCPKCGYDLSSNN
jgi:chromosome segregation ATPase